MTNETSITKRMALALLISAPILAAAAPALAAPTSDKKPAALTPKRQIAPSQTERSAFTVEDQEIAIIAGFPDARFWGDSTVAFLNAVPMKEGPWLALSGGGEDGAFGAGLLAGLTTSGKRPDFAVVTGSSTGALIAPFAFLGPRYDAALRKSYTTIHAGDVFEDARTPESLFDTWPLKRLIEQRVTRELLADIAVEHAKGRRLLVVTTNLDAGRPVVWDMGAIAARGNDKALKLFREVLLASSSIPGFFPPVHIDVEANGKQFREMHADGSIRAPFYVAPDGVLMGTAGARLPATQLYVVVNTRLTADFEMAPRNMAAVLGRSITIAMKAAMRGEILRVYAAAQRHGTSFNLAAIAPELNQPARGLFDPDYMQAMFDYGMKQGESDAPFRATPPGMPNATAARN